MSDDLRPELGCYGHPQIKTPNIDALAAAGVRFERAYCQYALCNPSRSSMLTGRQPTTTGVLDNTTSFRTPHPDFVSLPQHFKANGYAALRSGKIFHGGIDDPQAWTEGGDRPGGRAAPGRAAQPKGQPKAAQPLTRQQQSDRIIVLEGDGASQAESQVADRAIAFLRRHKEKPFFLACGFSKPHSPPTAPRKFFDLYDPAKVPLPVDFATKPTVPDGFPRPSVPVRNTDLFIGREASPEAAREMIRAYWASVSWMDSNVGRVLGELDALGLRDKTVIVFWGDHGYHLGEKGKWSKAYSVFEVGARVPLIVAVPGAKGNGRACARVVQSLDIYPTLCELCGLPKPAGLEGHSLAPLLADPNAVRDHPAYTLTTAPGGGPRLAGVAVRTQRYRYAEWDGGRGGAMLFDHDADPHELKNLADDPRHADVRAEHARLLRKLPNLPADWAR
jgi:arylsulfatase A-like enzyme